MAQPFGIEDKVELADLPAPTCPTLVAAWERVSKSRRPQMWLFGSFCKDDRHLRWFSDVPYSKRHWSQAAQSVIGTEPAEVYHE